MNYVEYDKNIMTIIKNKRFPPHGEFHFRIEENLLILYTIGPWNIESIIEMTENLPEIRNKINGIKWGVLAIITGQPLHTPDASKLASEILFKNNKNGLIASAMILDESNNPEFGKLHIANIYKKTGGLFEFFTDEIPAKNWLNDQLEDSSLDIKSCISV